MTSIALYIHIPFCNSKCDYCDFFSVVAEGSTKQKFEDALFHEIDLKKSLLDGKTISSVYIGGGTPSVLPATFFIKLKAKLDEVCEIKKDTEFTVEVNPSSFSEELAKTLREIGVNRLSFGFQSANDRLLKYVHRNQTFLSFDAAIKIAKKYFDNISVDLMTALPHQKLSDVKSSIKKVLKYKPTHVSVYSLMILPETPLYNLKQTSSFVPNENVQVKMLLCASKMLRRAGFEKYEVSNFAKRCKADEKRYMSKHNLTYWNGGDYLGFGPSAASKIGNVRTSNERNLKNYLEKNLNADREVLTDEQVRLERIMLGLRTKWGCNKALCKSENIPFLVKKGYIKEIGENLVVTEKGLNVLNIITDKLT